jgi:hypothetical protein
MLLSRYIVREIFKGPRIDLAIPSSQVTVLEIKESQVDPSLFRDCATSVFILGLSGTRFLWMIVKIMMI